MFVKSTMSMVYSVSIFSVGKVLVILTQNDRKIVPAKTGVLRSAQKCYEFAPQIRKVSPGYGFQFFSMIEIVRSDWLKTPREQIRIRIRTRQGAALHDLLIENLSKN